MLAFNIAAAGNTEKLFRHKADRAVLAQVTDVAVATYRTSTPLTYAESQHLRSILAANSERMPNGFVRPNSVNWDVALAQVASSGAFSTATVEAFRHQVADEQMHRQISQRRNEIGTEIMGSVRGEIWVPNFPALAPTSQTGPATISKAH